MRSGHGLFVRPCAEFRQKYINLAETVPEQFLTAGDFLHWQAGTAGKPGCRSKTWPGTAHGGPAAFLRHSPPQRRKAPASAPSPHAEKNPCAAAAALHNGRTAPHKNPAQTVKNGRTQQRGTYPDRQAGFLNGCIQPAGPPPHTAAQCLAQDLTQR